MLCGSFMAHSTVWLGWSPQHCVSSSGVHSGSSVLAILAYLFSQMSFRINFRIYLGIQTCWYFRGIALYPCIQLKTIDFFATVSSHSQKRDLLFTSLFLCVTGEFSYFTLMGFSHFLLSLFLNIL